LRHADLQRVMSTASRQLSGVVVLALLLVTATAACSSSAATPRAEAVTSSAPPAAYAITGGSSKQRGIVVGWRRDRDGAVAAASSYVAATGVVVSAGPLERRDVISVFASAAYGPTLVEQTDRRLDDLTFQLGARGVNGSALGWHEYPLTVRVDRDGPDRVD